MFVGIICDFVMVPGVFILYCPLRKKSFTFLSEGTNVHIQQHIHQKDLNLCYIMLLCQGCCWIGKNTNKKFSCVMVLIMRPSSTPNSQFVFGFNECLWETLPLWNFENFWFYIWIVVAYLGLLTSCHLLNPMPMNKTPESAKTNNIYYEILRKICERKSNLNFIRVTKS